MVTVREATECDSDAMLDLHVVSIRAFGPDAYDDGQVDAWAYTEGGPSYPIDDPGHVVVVAEAADGPLVGSATSRHPRTNCTRCTSIPTMLGWASGQRFSTVSNGRLASVVPTTSN